MSEEFLGRNDTSRSELDISTYIIYHILRRYISSVQKNSIDKENDNIPSSILNNNQILLSNVRKNQLIDQVISEAIAHFTTCAWEEKAQKLAGDILVALSGEKGRRKAYGTLIQDSRRR